MFGTVRNPEIGYSRTLELTTTTLDAQLHAGLFAPVETCNGLVMDTQGSELRVRATALLAQIDIVKTEAADFEAYVGCCRLGDLDAFTQDHGFAPFARHRFAERTGVGACYDVVCRRPDRANSPAAA